MSSISKENYLKTIYNLSKYGNGSVSPSSVARELNVSSAAISEMASKLSEQGYVDYKKYKGIKILGKGKKVATNIIRKHRLWELFLIKTLGLNWGEVHHEAEKLEHSTSDYLIDKIDEYLKFPKSDPHGAPIPTKNGSYRSKIIDIPISESEIGKSYKISRVSDENQELIKYLTQIELSLNTKIKVIDKLGFDGSVIIQIGDNSHTLSKKLSNNIFIKNPV
ncbi:MAG: metal-dependent transcriptional regulator [Melioribacteraceae bacterium]|nr:metal-dependent transcriptional regulator [Melioribacteraceae bacterium]